MITLPHVSSPTSRAAAERIRPHVPSILERVYQHILSCGLRGCNAWELEQALGISGSTLRPRLITLRGEDKKRPGPARIVTMGELRPMESGSPGVCWIAVGAKP
jgi:hypothetical protein